jgi:chromosome segregation ATPase
MDTPRTNAGDATYLDRQPDFDMTQEPSFQSPVKGNNLLDQMRNGRAAANLRTPRASRAALADRRNQLPQGLGGAEFTPMLKSATRRSARKHLNGKENRNSLTATPRGLGRIDEDMDMTNIPVESSLYGPSRSLSYVDATPMPHVPDDSTVDSTPVVLPPRRGADKGPLNDGNQLSLREQENVIDRIEKENFGLKLKIHFLEEALRKAGPGFSEAALKENTELKVDKVTLQRDLQKYKKQLVNAEKDLETYSEQILNMQEKAKKKYADESQKIEIDRLKQDLEDKEADIEDLQRQLERSNQDSDRIGKLEDEIGDLEADLREKDREISEREDEIEGMKEKFDDMEEKWKSAESRIAELEENAHNSDELQDAKGTIEDLEANARRLESEMDEMKEQLDQARTDKDRAEGDLEELQEEMSNKSVVTKGLSRQLDEKLERLQLELEQTQQKCSFLEQQTADKDKYTNELKTKAKQLLQQRDSWDAERQSLVTKLEQAEKDLSDRTDEKNLLQLRHDALGSESLSLQKDVAGLQKQIEELEAGLGQEKSHALQIEQNVRNQLKADIERLNDEIFDLQAEIREKESLYDNDSEKWENEKHSLESERDRAEERATGLQRTIDKLREAEGSLTNKEARLQEALNSEAERHKSEQAVLSRQIDDLRQDLEARQSMLSDLRAEVSAVRDELRQSQLDYQSQLEKVEALEDEVEVLQATLDEETEQASQSLAQAKLECEDLRQQLRDLQQDANEARAASSSSQQNYRQSNESLSRLQAQLSEAQAQLGRAGREKLSLQDQLANMSDELHSLRASLAEATAERKEAEDELRRFRQQDGDTFRLDKERIDLRTAKVKLDSEVRRLRDENRSLESQRDTMERNLEEEIERAAAEEDRLSQEILSLQVRMRQSSGNESQELASARRTIRDLERKLDEYEVQLAAQSIYPGATAGAEGNSELSLMRRDLSTARKKEMELVQREAGHKDVVRGLKRQIADLERKLHEAEMTQLVRSPNSSSASNSASARKKEVSELRHQLTAANKSLHDMRQKLRNAERSASKNSDQESVVQELQVQLEELEDEKLALEYAAADSQNEMAELKSQHDKAVRKLEHQIYKLQHSTSRHGRAVDNNTLEPNERCELRAMLRESQDEVQALEHDIRQQAAAIKSYESAQAHLRQKLDKARSERATYRTSARKLQDDCERLKAGAQEAIAWIESHNNSQPKAGSLSGPTLAAYSAAKEMAAQGRTSIRSANLVLDVVAQEDHEAVIRAADEATRRHEKELRGLALQMSWMQARWEREAKLRSDAAFAKRFLELRLGVAEAWYVYTCSGPPLSPLWSEPLTNASPTATRRISASSGRSTSSWASNRPSRSSNRTARPTTRAAPAPAERPSARPHARSSRRAARRRRCKTERAATCACLPGRFAPWPACASGRVSGAATSARASGSRPRGLRRGGASLSSGAGRRSSTATAAAAASRSARRGMPTATAAVGAAGATGGARERRRKKSRRRRRRRRGRWIYSTTHRSAVVMAGGIPLLLLLLLLPRVAAAAVVVVTEKPVLTAAAGGVASGMAA